MKLLNLIILFIFCTLTILGQQQTAPASRADSLVLRCANTDGVVKLRWAPTSQGFWSIGKTKGYILERITHSENGRPVDPPMVMLLSNEPILPAAKEVWISKIDENDAVAIIAQAFWGETFQLKAKKTTTKSTAILDQIVDMDQRFAFSLMAADMNFEAASMAGWGFTDKEAAPDGIYTYRVYINDKTIADSIVAQVTVNMKLGYVMPPPFGIYTRFDENLASVSWELSFTKHIYTAYNIERSTDNVNFIRLNKTPFVVTSSSADVEPPKRGQYNDSIPNDITYYYRLSGIDCFGQTGPYSKVMSGKAFRRLKETPKITGYKYKSEQFVTFTWSFNKEQENLIKGFEVYRAAQIEGPYELISGLLPSDTRDFEFEMLPSNYVAVRAIGINKEDVTASGPQFIDQPDVTPPAQPAKPQGKIDSAGVVTIWWKPNTEKDLDGYYVYWSRLEGEEFVLMNELPITDTIYRDTITLNTFVEHIDYQIRAVDVRFNHSKPSERLVLKLPDILKPVSPYFLRYNVNADSINLEWVNSSSYDVAMHLLFRKEEKEKEWQQIARYDTLGVTHFTDHNLEERKSYSYMLLAIDDDSLKSEPSKPATLFVPIYKKAPPVEKFTVSLDRENSKMTLKWKKNETIKGFQLYKQEGEWPPFLYQFFDGKESKFTDAKIKPFLKYTYQIRTVGINGLYSEFETQTIQW